MEHKELYKIRFDIFGRKAIAKYVHVKDNIYQDTTCKDRPNCLISVKEENGKIVFDKAENDTAIKYMHYHIGTYYVSQIAAKTAILEKSKTTYEEAISKIKKSIEECKSIILKKHLKVDYIENIENINFDDNLFAISNEDIIQLTVTLKKITKCGTVAIIGSVENKDDSEFILEKDDLKSVTIRDVKDYGYDSEVDRILYVFPTKKSAENYIKNTKSDSAEYKLKKSEKNLKDYEEELNKILHELSINS